ncbi:MAG: molybdopterin-dependent oxidoreductase [Oceanospirillum sp.]|nr:molybdopterin-dependent oxidoreductase [Oceanospirillum sp.]
MNETIASVDITPSALADAGSGQWQTSTTCPYCGVGCGVDVTGTDEQVSPVKGSREHPANLGRLCVKGSALHETLGMEGRLLAASIDRLPVTLDHALDHVADGFRKTLDRYGPDSVAFYVSGQLLTEDYYVANKLMKGFIGSGNIDTNSRLCMSSAVAAYKRAFGSDSVPCSYEDIELADLVILVGSNAAWTHPVVYQRLSQAKRQRPELLTVVIDPRQTATCDEADLYLDIDPGTDAFLFNGLLAYLAMSNCLDRDFIRRHTENAQQTLEQVCLEFPDPIQDTARTTGVSEEKIARFFDMVAQYRHTVTLYSQGVNQSTTGADKCNSIINYHLATGRIGAPGMGPFSMTGQPNAMGGREVGGLANQLAAHMDFTPESIDLVGRFWNSKNMATQPGMKAVDLFKAVESGQIKAIWIMATNPAVSLPDAEQIERALKACPLVVVSECFADAETLDYANVVLPAAGWGEKDGTVTNSERRISRQRAFTKLQGDIKPDWWLISQVAQRMGYQDAFNYASPADIFREHATLSGFENLQGQQGARDFDISLLARLNDEAYDKLKPVQWPINSAHPLGTPRLFTDQRFFTPSGKARFVTISPQKPALAPDKDYPFILNTGRVRDQWHTMTRTARSQRLMSHISEPFVEVETRDARRLGLEQNQLIRLQGRQGEFLGRVKISNQLKQGSLFAPIHWNNRYTKAGKIDSLVNALTDPVSGQPESKHAPVQVEKTRMRSFGFMVLQHQSPATGTGMSAGITTATSSLKTGEFPHELDYWSRIPLNQGDCFEVAHSSELQKTPLWQQHLQTEGDWLHYEDPAQGIYRAACFKGNTLQQVLICAGEMNHLPDRDWINSLIGQPVSPEERLALLSGHQSEGSAQGKTVCACFQVGENAIRQAITEGCDSAESLGKQLKCGTNCGSCIPELKALVNEQNAIVNEQKATST